MNCIEIKHTDFTEEILTSDYYSYYLVEYKCYDQRRIAFISIDFDRPISENINKVLLVDYNKSSGKYINTNIVFGSMPMFQVQHISPSKVMTFFKIETKAKEFVQQNMMDETKDIYYFFNKYLELLSE